MPRIFWHSLNTRYGINIKNLVDAAKKYESVDSYSNKEKILVYLCRNLLRSIQYNDYRNKEKFDPTNNDSYLNSRIELSKMLLVMPDDKNLPEISHKKIIKINKNLLIPKNKVSSAFNEENYQDYQLYSKLEEYENKKSKRNTSKKRSNSQNNDANKTVHISRSSKYKDSKKKLSQNQYLIIDNFDLHEDLSPKVEKFSIVESQDVKDMDTIEFSTLDLIRSRITHLSRKHVFNLLTTGYDFSSSDVKEPTTVYSKKFSKHQLEQNKITKCFHTLIPDFSRNYLSTLYIFVKFLYLLNPICQFFVLSKLIGNEFYMLGINLLKSFITEKEWPHLATFPRMTLCEIYIREVGTVHPYLIQCVLRINLFNEIIFIMVWFWLLFLIIVNAVDLIVRLIYIIFACSNCQRKLFALKNLELIHMNSTSNINLNSAASRGKYENEIYIDKKINFIKILQNKKEKIIKKTKKKKGEDKTVYDMGNSFENLSEVNQLKRNKDCDGNTIEGYYDNSIETEPLSINCSNKVKQNYYLNENKEGMTSYENDDYTDFSASFITEAEDLNEKQILVKANEEEEFEMFERFCENNFTNDTIFALKVMQKNASCYIVSEIIEYLWTQFKRLNFIYSNEHNDYFVRKILVTRDSFMKNSDEQRNESLDINVSGKKIADRSLKSKHKTTSRANKSHKT